MMKTKNSEWYAAIPVTDGFTLTVLQRVEADNRAKKMLLRNMLYGSHPVRKLF